MALLLGVASTAYYVLAFARHDERIFEALPRAAGSRVARYVWTHVGLGVAVSAACLLGITVAADWLGGAVSRRWDVSIEGSSSAFWAVVATLVLTVATISCLVRLGVVPRRRGGVADTESGPA